MHDVPYHPPPFPPMSYPTGPDFPYALYPPYPIPGAPVAESGNEKPVQASPLPPPPPQGYPRQHQRGYGPRNMPHGAGPRDFVRPPYMGQGPGFMVGPGPGFPGPVYYFPVPPPGAIRGYPPRFGPHPGNQGPQALDENLQNDQYLISLMDEQGWVPIKIIDDFKRVKMMNMDVEFIAKITLKTLQSILFSREIKWWSTKFEAISF
ncbi:la-related protein 1A-like isoform X1 [Brassica rapa]|uniref:la-related protein 1A-like n=2 Tax=Brassica campestris TaxID=3711 RepID=UPI00142E3657|nr:la-related protein 1A-like isoform X1 [Brassica rapa]XP_009106925.2 la-related protein 1A-like isoform X1 [Brassica rapa]XP_009106926.2 la-related protein 1A-like isoform X1 [Brassica rapa]XP_009106927.2 la-related protein 1A-like isoform X1 [Brassica rapa]XP_013740385.2 la-related protein 1A isoform X1 [Brassica napus]XP_013740399.2 la-related protein 1A isoform X1 [Brassica napus]XP_022545434.2 la-related protein 1A isoform X1 [Brassica napus]XP_033132020.1 la-related protein 1A-like [B